MTSVRHCLSDDVLSIDRLQKFAKRARRYIQVYDALDNSGRLEGEVMQRYRDLGPVIVEQLIKTEFTRHRGVTHEGRFI
jgi:hypothetical protein